jgi:surfeit locus 1 family protein
MSENAARPRRAGMRSWRGLLLPAIAAFAVLVALGTWQIERKAWKEALIATLTQRLAAPPGALPPAALWPSLDPAEAEFRRARFTATFDHDHEALVYSAGSAFRTDVSGPGYWVFTPARLSGDGGTVMVNRGFVPEGRKSPASRAEGQVSGPVEMTGALRWPEKPGMFTPQPDPAHNLWFARDPRSMAAAKGVGPVAPFYLEQEAPAPPGGWPRPGPLQVHLRNDHLQYALTWYGLALVLAAVFAAWVRAALRAGRHSL